MYILGEGLPMLLDDGSMTVTPCGKAAEHTAADKTHNVMPHGVFFPCA